MLSRQELGKYSAFQVEYGKPPFLGGSFHKSCNCRASVDKAASYIFKLTLGYNCGVRLLRGLL